MESFKINVEQNEQDVEVLVIPDDCIDQSIFHLVIGGSEVCKLKYTDTGNWTIIEGKEMSEKELGSIGTKIEKQYF